MKKQIGIFTAILFAVSTLMVGCKAEVHTHTFAEEWSSDETNHWHAATCECSDVELQKTEHIFGKWEVIKEATEDAKGSQEKSCSVCEYKVTEEIAKVEHTHKFASEWTNDETNHWYASTCGHEVTEGKTAHTFGDWITTKAATCTEEGSKTGVCEVCKKEVTEKIDAKGHSYSGSWKTDDKNHWKECTGCKEKLESAEHEYEWTVTKDATCTDEGSETGVCKVCKKEVTEKIDAKGHSGSWKNDDKNHWKECTGCKEKIDVKVHSYSESWTKDASGHWHACVCGAKKDFEEHTYGTWKVVQEPTASTEGTSKRECKICSFEETKQIIPIPEGFVLVEAGTFKMGSNEGWDDNKPVHQVTITKSFYMGKYEVTQTEYEKYCSYTGDYSPDSSYGDGDNYPAYYVSWYDALVYCNKRSIAEGLSPCYSISGNTDPSKWGKVPTSSNNSTWNAVECNWNANGYRLPTEAEWEYAARAGDNIVDSLTYSGTSDVNKLGEYAWNESNSNDATHKVGTKLPNAYGLYDMSGNLWEWCWNWYTDKYDAKTEGGSDPTGGASSGRFPNRVYRGGGWGSGSDCCAVSCRSNYGYPSFRYDYLGFRVVRRAN